MESQIAKFLKVESCILYSHGFSTVSSVIPCFSKRGDIIVCDSKTNFAIKNGCDISRSKVKYFNHNNISHLEEILIEVEKDIKKNSRYKDIRKFIVVEGIYSDVGDICLLKDIVALKNKYKYRLIVDESISIGSLGSDGRGVSSFYGIETSQIDIIIGSLANCLGSSGGFCAGSEQIVDRQRLAGLSHVFSASLPGVLTNVAIEALNMIKENPIMLDKLNDYIKICYEIFNKSTCIKVLAEKEKNSPIFILTFKDNISKKLEGFQFEKLIQNVVQKCIDKNVLTSRIKSHEINTTTLIAIRFIVCIDLTKEEITKCANCVDQSFKEIINQHNLSN